MKRVETIRCRRFYDGQYDLGSMLMRCWNRATFDGHWWLYSVLDELGRQNKVASGPFSVVLPYQEAPSPEDRRCFRWTVDVVGP